MALLYFGHVSIHLDHSNSSVLNLILLNLELKYKKTIYILTLILLALIFTLHKIQGQHQHFHSLHCLLHSIVTHPNLN